MNVALIHLGIDGAGPLYSLEMARSLTVQTQLLLVIVSKHTQNIALWRELSQNNCNVKLVEINSYISKKDFISKTLNFNQFLMIYKSLKYYNINVLYSPMTDLWQPIIFKFFVPKGVMKIKTIHDLTPHLGEDRLIIRIYHYFNFKNADKVVILSKTFIPQVEQEGVALKDIIVIPHANFSHYASYNSPKEKKITHKLLFFGRILEYKGLDILLEAMKIVVKQNPKISLVIAGSGNIISYKKGIDEIKDNIELHIRRIEDSEIEVFFNKSDIVVLPYKEASQSGVIPVAFSFGKPVIATNLGGIPEQLEHGGGVLIEPNDVNHLAIEILNFYDNTDKIFQYGATALLVSEKEMSWNVSAEKLINGILR